MGISVGIFKIQAKDSEVYAGLNTQYDLRIKFL